MKLKKIPAIILALALASSVLNTAAASEAAADEAPEITIEVSEKTDFEESAEASEETDETAAAEEQEDLGADTSEAFGEDEIAEEASEEITETTDIEASSDESDETTALEEASDESEEAAETETAEAETETTTEETEDEYAERLTAPELSGDILTEESQNADLAYSVRLNTNAIEAADNLGAQNYSSYCSSPVYSYLIDNGDNTFTRVQLARAQILVDGALSYADTEIVIEDYNGDDFSLTATHHVDTELSKFGGFYAGENYNFFVFGQNNPDEDDSVEVMRIVRYTKDWERVDDCRIYGANTYIPFDAGSLRMAESGDMLYIRTCHEMYESSDGNHHQANLTIFMQISTMTVTWEFSGILNPAYGYVSHSFNQFIITDGENLITLDQGDAYPRAAVLMKYNGVKAGDTSVSSGYKKTTYTNVLEFSGEIGYNFTRASLGGLEASDTAYLTAGNSIDQSLWSSGSTQRNIYVTSTDKDNYATSIHRLTDYEDGEDMFVSTPHLIKINSDKFLLMWTENDQSDEASETTGYDYGAKSTTELKWVFIDGEGNASSEIYSTHGYLSDCKPVVSDNRVIWYVIRSDKPLFCVLDINNPEEITISEDITLYSLTYSIENGEAEITGCYREFLPEECIIPDTIDGCPVTSIGEDAFIDCYGLKKITLPESVTSIGGAAFNYCTGLTEINIPEGVTSIETSAFYNCKSLKEITLPKNITNIGIWAFDNCTSLTEITIPESVTSLGSLAFNNCTGLTKVVIEAPDNITNIETNVYTSSSGYSVFYGCTGLVTAGEIGGDYNVQIGWTDTVGSGSKLLKHFTSLTSVTIPNGVTAIDSEAFSSCKNLTEIIIPDSVTSIGSSAFYYCSGLTQIKLPKNLTSIESRTFYGCSALKEISIPEGVTEIGSYAFYKCSGLTETTLPKSLTAIGDSAFGSCSGLTKIIIPESVIEIGWTVFEECTGLVTAGPIGGDYNIQFGWTETIPDNAFYKIECLTSAEIPDSITSIGKCAFYRCSGLTEITLPENITSIGGSAFSSCTGLTKLIIPENAAISGIGKVFSGCTGLVTAGPIGGDYNIQFGWSETIPDSSFYGLESLTRAVLPSGITSIGSSAFYDCKNLAEIELPDTLTSINNYAFRDCVSLPEIDFPESLKEIGYYAFSGCDSLSEIILPDGVTKINYAFYNCTGLTEITIPKSVKNMYTNIFEGCGNLVYVYCYKNSAADNSALYPEGVTIVYLTSPVETGDVNGDESINVLDLVAIFDHIQGTASLEGDYLDAADINGDADVNVLDLSALFDIIQG